MKDDLRGLRTSSYSKANQNCVEVGQGLGVIVVRDTKLGKSPVLTASPQAWRAFLAWIKGA